MQLLIMFTSNHNWFNLLTLALCLFLFDDKAIRKILPEPSFNWLSKQSLPVTNPRSIYHFTMPLLASFIFFISSVQIYEMLTSNRAGGFVGEVMKTIKPLAIVNKYHVFPTMRTERYELLIYGSIDGKQWHEYRFKYKPGELTNAPDLVMPHHPRLDWLMWFVTLNSHFMPFFESFLGSLLEGSTSVNGLLQENPFPDDNPNVIRIDLYRYQFTDHETRLKTGQWWQREYLGPFPPLPFIERPGAFMQE